MNKDLQVIQNLIEQAMANGLFKKLDQLDIARNAVNNLNKELQQLQQLRNDRECKTVQP
jgi:hypothetical protein